MKIAILSPWTVKTGSVGGTERFVIDLAESFARANNEVDVYMLAGEEYKKNNVNYKNIDLFDGKKSVDEYFLKKEFNNFNDENAFINLAQKIESKVSFVNYDLLQINSQLFLKVAEDKKRIFTIHTNPFEYKLDWGDTSFEVMIKLMQEESILPNTFFVAPSKYYSQMYQELSGAKMNFIPHAIDINRLKTNKDKMDIYKEMGIESNKKVIILPSRLEPIQKQPMLFMKAFARQSDEIKSNFKVICTGVDKQYEKFCKEIIEFCKKNKIDVLIKRFEEMTDGYKVADIVVLPSKSESFGYSALEAISLGIPIIINEIPTYMEIVQDANNYYSFNNSVESLADVLNNVLRKDLARVKQPAEWTNKYILSNFANHYLSLK